MRRASQLRPAALLLALSLPVAGCGGNAEKEALRAYEAAVEGLVDQDARIAVEVEELGRDLAAENLEGARYSPFLREQALPFFRKFQQEVARLAPDAATPRLREVHDSLGKYVAEQLRDFERIDALLRMQESEAMTEFGAALRAQDEAFNALAKATGGKLEDGEARDAILALRKFQAERLGLLYRGTLPAADMEREVRRDILPRLERLAERTVGDREAPGVPGAVARWAGAALAFSRSLLRSAPEQARIGQVLRERLNAGDVVADARKKFLEGLKSYRESLR